MLHVRVSTYLISTFYSYACRKGTENLIANVKKRNNPWLRSSPWSFLLPLADKAIVIVISSYFQLKKLLLLEKSFVLTTRVYHVSLQVSPMQDGQIHIY